MRRPAAGTVALAGATGVLGRALVPRLRAAGFRVRALVRGPRPAPEGAEAVLGDLLDEAAAARLVEGCDAAIHAATAIPSDPADAATWARNRALRVDGTRILLAASARSGARRYLQQSIALAYADGGDRWLDESAPLDPGNRATASLIAMEEQVRASPLDWDVFRGGIFVGPGTFEDARIEALRRGALAVPGDGAAWMPYVHVEDVADGVVAMLAHPAGRRVLHLVDAPVRQGDYLDRLAASVGAPAPRRDPSLPPLPSMRCSGEAARAAIGWTPRRGIWRR